MKNKQKSQKSQKSYVVGIFVLFVILNFIFFTNNSLAAPDAELTYHGKLTDTSNVAVSDGSYDFKLSIYTTDTGGTPVWTARGTTASPTAKSITLTNGIFSTNLGESGDNPLNIDFDTNYYLGVTIGANSEMTPRRKITPTGYALNSLRLNGLTADNYIDTSAIAQVKSGALSVNSDFTVNTDDFFVDTNNSRVGIGTATPTQPLDVIGNIETTNQLISTQITGTAPLSVASTTLNINLNADLLDGQQGSYYMPVSTDNWINTTGDTLTGTLNVTDIIPSLNITYDLGSDANRFKDIYISSNTLHLGTNITDEGIMSYDTTNNILNFNTDSTTNGDIAFNTDDLFIDKSSGNIGIGDLSPAYKLEISGGDINTTGGGYRDAGSCVAGTCASDIRLKENIQSVEGSLEKILQLNPSTFSFIDEKYGSKGINYGFIAQELELIYPEWVITDETDGYKRVKYGLNLQMATIDAIQEQNQLITTNSNNINLNATATSVSELQTLTEQQFTDTTEILNQVEDDVLGMREDANILAAQTIPEIQSDILELQDSLSMLSILTNIDTRILTLNVDKLIFVSDEVLSQSTVDDDGNEIVEPMIELTLEGLLNTQKIVTQELETNVLTINDDVTVEDSEGEDVNASSVGMATIEAGNTDIVIETISATDSAQIFVTAKTYLEQPLYISEILNEESFTVSIANSLDDDVEFSWFIVKTNE